MNRSRVSLQQVVAGLAAEGLLPAESTGAADALIGTLAAVQPWYVRTMIAIGAWLASLLLIGFFAGFALAVGGDLVVGAVLIIGAIALRRQSDNDFVVQCALAGGLAGQAMFAFSIARLVPGDNVELLCAVVIVLNIVLFFVFPDRIHRVLSVLFAMGALVLLVYSLELNAIVPVLGPLLAAALVLLHRNRGAITQSRRGHFVRPLENGLMLGAFGCLLLSAIYLLPELDTDFVFYPRPWISTLLLAPLFALVGLRSLAFLVQGRGKLIVPGLLVLIIACAWAMPGLLLALIVVLLGTASGNRSFTGAGIVFLAVFVAAYFYGNEMTLLVKSITLVGSGIALLATRWLLLRLLSWSGEGVRYG